ncbi:hypothetical protein SCUCBS95973_001641 [Sporothrix curviconia]|uniref:[histone H3]-trimethyl-L-lysine(9) demethylase n=1 Tax=Sporothrix curviconia TaxID=1260050 RepID=A0ABP0B079_9PEZI
MSSKAISAQALGGEADTIAVVSPLQPLDDNVPTSSETAAAPAAAPAMMPATAPADPQPPPAGSDTSLPLPPPSALPADPIVPVSGSDRATTGLHSPPDSNNATKLDGSSSDSELSDLDDEALAETFRGLQSDAGATATSATTPTAVGGDTVYAASATAPCPSTTPVPDNASAEAAAAPAADAAAAADEEDDIGEVEPDHFSGTVPVFRPTMQQFRDFKKFMSKIDKYGMKSGIVKIIPPQEWKDSLEPLDNLVKTIKVREPIKQDIMGSNGTYRQVNILHQRTYNLPQWRQLCDQSEHQPPARRGERRANADKPKPAPRPRAAAAPSASSQAKKGAAKKGRGGRRGGGGRTQCHTADDDNASVVSEPRPMTPESQRGDDEKMALDDDKTCVETPQDASDKHTENQDDAHSDILSSVEVEYPIKREPDADDDSKTGESSMADIPVAPRRMGFVRQAASSKTQSTSARRKYAKREGSAKIDEAAFKDWDYRMDVSDYTPERCEELERTYWKTLTYAQPLYGADLPGTLFSESTDLWNLNKLPNLLDVLGTKVPGVNTAYLYLGMWKATFAWHLEDVDLYSINYLHFGAPKQWYSISQGDARRFEAAMKNIWPQDAKACDQFLRHKAFLISPSHLQQHYNIRVNKCVSYPGEFVVTYPYGYHSGYNLGYNCAEAVNFALESWLPMGKIAKKCECAEAQDSVWVDVYEIERKLRGISTDDEDDEFDDDDDDEDDDSDEEGDSDGADSVAGLPTPPSGRRGQRVKFLRRKARNPIRPSAKRRRAFNDGEVEDPADDENYRRMKKMRTRLWCGDDSPCCLCPNNFPDHELLPTDDGRDAHRVCADYLPETRIEAVDGKDVVKGVSDIQMPRLNLHCLFCRHRKGVCESCSQPKCNRSYHATCAAAAGVFVNEVVNEIVDETVDEAVEPSGRDGNDEAKSTTRTFEFTCRFHRSKRNRKLQLPALESNERILAAAAELKPGDTCQMQLYRSDIFAGVVLENRHDEETLLLRVIPSREEVEVGWSWLLVPNPVDYAARSPAGVKRKRLLVRVNADDTNDGDAFVDGLFWKQLIVGGQEPFVPVANQTKVDLDMPNRLWYYLGSQSTEYKAQYTDDPANPVHHHMSNFLRTLPDAAPLQTPSTYVALVSIAESALPAVPASSVPSAPIPVPASNGQQPPGQSAGQPGTQQSTAEPRRSYSVIKPPYVPHTSPVTSASPAPVTATTAASAPAAAPAPAPVSTAAATPAAEGPANKIRKTSDGFVQPQQPASRSHQPGHRHRHRSSSTSRQAPFGPFFSMPKAGAASSKFPQIQHPNLSHGYATVPMAKPQSTPGGSAMSPPSGSAATSSSNSPDASSSKNPDGSNVASASSIRRNSTAIIRGPNRVRKSSSGAASLAAAAARLHKRSASSISSVSSFSLGLGGGLAGLSRPSPHTNYVGPPPVPSSTASSPLLSAHNMNFNPRPGSSVSSYASYESIMGVGPGMSPHSPGAVDASPFIGSPGPQMGGFDFSGPSPSNGFQHPGMRPQFGSMWQHSFNAPLGSFAPETDVNFSPPSPMSTILGLPATGGLGAPANIIPGHQPSYSYSGPVNLGGDSLFMGGNDFGGFGTISPPMVPESPMPMMSPTLEDIAPPDAGTSQSPAEQLKQQLRSISDSSLPASYRLRCLHQPRRRHQSRSSLNRIFTSQLLDLNPT